jgi:hypothetical protein
MGNTEITDFYNSLDNIKSLSSCDVQKTILPFDNKIDKENEWKIIAERKVLFIQYDFQSGKLIIPIQNLDVEGKPIIQNLLNKEEIQYLNNRVCSVNSLFLKAKYSHFLWQETKHLNNANSAISFYFELIKIVEESDFDNLIKILSSLIYISNQAKTRKTEVKVIIDSIIEISPNWKKYNLIKLLLENKFLEKVDFEKHINDIVSWYDENNYFGNIEHYELGIALCSKIQKNDNIFYELLAKNEDLILNGHPNKEDFIHITTLGKKCQYLQKTSNKEDLEKCLIQYNDAKQYVKLNKISVPFDDELNRLFNEYIKFKSQEILKHTTNEILGFFSLEEELLVNPKTNEENTKNNYKNSIHNLWSVVSLDININTSQLTEEQKIHQQKVQNYGLEFMIKFHSFFYITLINGIIQGKLNYHLVYNFLENHTWYGNKFKRELKDNEIEDRVNWISLIAPSLHIFFTQFEFSTLLDENKVNNFILCLDSLTLKFEGAIRDFIRLCGGNTSKVKAGVLQELLLEDLLDNKNIKELFSERDIELFKYTFTKNGVNLRNNIAHSFMSYSDYSLQNVSLVLLCFLRLGKYELVKKI